jgi:hypothetical protein
VKILLGQRQRQKMILSCLDVAMQGRRNGRQKPGFIAERKIQPANPIRPARFEHFIGTRKIPPGLAPFGFWFTHIVGTILQMIILSLSNWMLLCRKFRLHNAP